MNKISAKIVADSVNPQGDRITSFILTYPRFIHSELMTHRMFSRNSASSRAIPFAKMVKSIEEDPFIPIAWQKDHKGMQGNEYITDERKISYNELEWLIAKDKAVEKASELNSLGVTKQLCNRLLEPFMWHTVLVTATEFENFFTLRCPIYELYYEQIPMSFNSKKDLLAFVKKVESPEFVNQYDNLTDLDWIKASKSGAEIHIQALAEAMWDARNESIPEKLQEGEWHIPFGDKMDDEKICTHGEAINIRPKIATARCARTSYMTFDGEIDYEKDIKLHDHLLESRHMSPFEHCAKAMDNIEYYSYFKGGLNILADDGYNIYSDISKENEGFGWCNNFKGFIQYRYLIEKRN